MTARAEKPGTVHCWQAVGAISFAWVDARGHVVGGWEESDARGTHCVVMGHGPVDEARYTVPQARRFSLVRDLA